MKTKSHVNEVTNFYDKKFPKLDSNHTCLAVVSLDSAPQSDFSNLSDDFEEELILKLTAFWRIINTKIRL